MVQRHATQKKSWSDKTATCKNRFCGSYVKRTLRKTKKMVHSMLRQLGERTSKYKGPSQRDIQRIKDKCVLAFCNPTCKGTVFEDGRSFPSSLSRKLRSGKNNQQLLRAMKSMRRNLFRGKSSVLQQGFYKGLAKRKQLQQQGAISGCAVAAM